MNALRYLISLDYQKKPLITDQFFSWLFANKAEVAQADPESDL